jgi:hypothetical protein
MISYLKHWFARRRAKRRGEMGEKPLIDWEAADSMLERSRIPAVVVLVLVWAVASVVLILSWTRQQQLLDWVDGQAAPYNIKAMADFSYVDSVATARKREAARENEPVYFRLDDRLTNSITDNINDFFVLIENRVVDESQRRNHAVSGSLAASVVAKASPMLAEALTREYRRNDNYPVFRKRLNEMLVRGIVGAAPAERKVVKTLGETAIRIIDGRGRISRENFILGDFPTVSMAAALLSSTLFPVDIRCRDEFQTLLLELIGPQGNLNCDLKHTEEARAQAAAAVEPVKVDKSEGMILIRKGDRFTPEKREMIDAALRATPRTGFEEAYHQMVWSFAIVMAGVFFLFLISTDIRRDNLRILLAGMTVAISLAVNYQAVKISGYLLRHDTLHNENLILSAIPVALVAVMLSILLDCRTAICCGGIVAVITSMMIMPTRSLELALRWTAISSVAALAVRNVTNYRSFFMRTTLSVFVLTLTINLIDIFYSQTGIKFSGELGRALLVIFCNALFCAMAALTLIFIFELLFNLSTNMALMVLCDCNHPLLERLKREAPGTMAHSMAVATLAEDAALAIGANPLRAKAGALFHDIGKLSMPQYFTENNPDSALLHEALNPQMSGIIIRDHVKEGLALARQYRLCRFIRGVITSHHGDDLVRFFYRKALEEQKQGGAPVLESQFRYHGNPPKSREEGIINLADACEAASRSLRSPTKDNITELVHNIIMMRVGEGQLRNSHLTTADLDKLEKSFVASLSSSMHGRVAYPAGDAPQREGRSKC